MSSNYKLKYQIEDMDIDELDEMLKKVKQTKKKLKRERLERERLEREEKERERLERERLERQQEFNIIFNNINQTIRNKHNQIGSSISNYTDVLSSFGYTLLETHNSSTLGDCVNRISTVPRSIKNQHISRLNSGSDWDNRFELYENGNYIIGCQRCLKLWDHECCCVVYKKE